jgi:hypothetical protein
VTPATTFQWRRSLPSRGFYLLDLGMKRLPGIVVEEGDEAFRHYNP